MLEFESKKLEVKLNGTVYSLDFPKVKGVRDLQEKQKEKGESIDHIIDFLCSHGLPKEVIEEMEISHLEKIVDALVDQKKR